MRKGRGFYIGGGCLVISLSLSPPPPPLPLSQDKVDASEAPHIHQFADQNVRSSHSTSAFPSLTFPNHYTIVTGELCLCFCAFPFFLLLQ